MTVESLYDRDFVAWCSDTCNKLRSHRWEEIDLERLIEEIDSLGKSDRREVRNRLTVLMAHLLKRMYVDLPENFKGWELTIIEQRQQIGDLLRDSPSLKPYAQESLPSIYAAALERVEREYEAYTFPPSYPFEPDISLLLMRQYWK